VEGSSVPKPYTPPPLSLLRRFPPLSSDDELVHIRCRFRTSATSTSTAWLAAAGPGGEAVGLATETRRRTPRSSARRQRGSSGSALRVRGSAAPGGGPNGAHASGEAHPLPPEVRVVPRFHPSTRAATKTRWTRRRSDCPTATTSSMTRRRRRRSSRSQSYPRRRRTRFRREEAVWQVRMYEASQWEACVRRMKQEIVYRNA
jgi:hypothetical protein